jgi:hypothetical protein
MKRSDLLDLVYRFHPRGMHEHSLGYDDTEECFRRREAARRGVAGYPTWRALLSRLGGRHSVVDHSLCLLADWCLVAYSGYFTLPGPTPGCGHTLGFHVSLIGPYYGIRRRGAPGEEEAALDFVRAIEEIYPGYQPIPPELGNQVVPDVSLNGRFGKTTIYECILSYLWETDSGPYYERHVEPLDDPGPPAPGAGDVEDDTHYHDVRS